MQRKGLIILIGCLIFVQQAAGALVSRDWQTLGDDLLTYDADSGLEWLDLTVTSNMSVNQVTAALSAEFSGFRYALPAELDMLQIAAGLPSGSQVVESEYFGPSPYIQPGLDLIQFLGSMIVYHPPNYVDRTDGWFATPSEAGRSIAVTDEGPPTGLELTILGFVVAPVDRYNLAILGLGSFLVRETTVIPLPATAPLFVSALGLLWLRRRTI